MSSVGSQDLDTRRLLERYAGGERSFPRANLAGANLSNVNLGGVNLEYANLANANLEHAYFEDAILTGANFNNANLEHAKLARVDLRNASFLGASLIGADLSNAKLNHAYLVRSDLQQADLTRAILGESRIMEANLARATLRQAKAIGASLRNSLLCGADMTGADLSEANLTQADLSGARLKRANISHADFSNANLTRANLSGANFAGAYISGTILAGTNLGPIIRAKVHHYAPSQVDWSAIVQSVGEPLLKDFLRRMGVPDVFVEYMVDCARSLEPGMIFSLLQSTFISYGGPDEAFARKLNEALERRGVITFFFRDDAPPGEKLHRVMRKGVNDHDRTILICSESSLQRPGLLNELEETLAREARDGGRPYLLPIRLDDYVIKGWAPRNADIAQAVRDRVIADFRHHEDSAEFEASVARLIAVLKKPFAK